MKKFIFSTMIIASVVGCTQRGANADVESNEIRLFSGMADPASSKATKVAFTPNSEIEGLQILRAELPAPGVPNFENSTLLWANRDASAQGAITWQNPQYYKPTSEYVYFASYYPSGVVVNKVTTMTIDGKTDIITAPMVYAGNATSPQAAMLSYSHELAQIEVICTTKQSDDNADVTIAAWGNITRISIQDTKPSMTYTWATRKTAAVGANSTIDFVSKDYTTDFASQPIAKYSATPEAIAFGMFAPSNSQFLTLKLQFDGAGLSNGGIRTATVDLGTGKTLKKGYKHVITCTFTKNTNTPINAQSTIEDWKTGGANGDIEFN